MGEGGGGADSACLQIVFFISYKLCYPKDPIWIRVKVVDWFRIFWKQGLIHYLFHILHVYTDAMNIKKK